MERNVIDKINATKDLLNGQIETFNVVKENFRREFFTAEMSDIIRTIIKSTGNSIVYKLNDTWCLVIDATLYPEFYNINDPIKIGHTFYIGDIKISKDPSQKDINQLESHAKNFKRIKKVHDLFMDKAEVIACYIVDKYRKINEDGMDQLNNIMEMLGESTDDVRHIKITVEWY